MLQTFSFYKRSVIVASAMAFVLFLLLIGVTTGAEIASKHFQTRSGSSEYDYSNTESGPSGWSDNFPDYCSGASQSPVDLVGMEPITCEPFQFTGYDVVPDTMTIENNGHTAKIGVTMDAMPTVSGGCLGDTYEFLQMHWHWGSSAGKGSEHLIDGIPYSMELHLVHWNTKYETVGEALKNADGLAVLGIMVKESLESPPDSPYNQVAKSLKRIRQYGESSEITPKKLEEFLPQNTRDYFRYSGSLTTPTCNEIVTWTVFQENVRISKNDINEFRQLEDTKGRKLVNNYRPAQPLNDRTVYVAA